MSVLESDEIPISLIEGKNLDQVSLWMKPIEALLEHGLKLHWGIWTLYIASCIAENACTGI